MVSQEELDRVQAYMNSVLPDSFEFSPALLPFIARYSLLRMSNLAFLDSLANKDKAQVLTPEGKAWKDFNSAVCPACGGPKRGGEDGHWFCNANCWKRLDLKMRQALRFGFRGQDLPMYWRALNFLKQEIAVR
jgi:hypothetical protein